MSVLDIFKRKKKEVEILQHVSATLYPGRILVQTYDRAKERFWLGTTNLSFLNSEIDDKTLGATIRHYMSLTKTEQPRPVDWKQMQQLFLKAAGFKTQKEEYKDAKNVSISRKGPLLTITTSINGEYNGRTRAFWGNGDLELQNNISDAELGLQVRKAWQLCK